MSGPHLGSTYRLQLHGIGFRRAAALVPYLADLGIETLYLSPIWAAVPGSTHGYDVVDPCRLDPALGSAEDLDDLLGTLHVHGMAVLLDVVPNHMAADRANAWWWDVLRHGRAAPAADVFDIDWDRHGGRVLVPVLERPLADFLARGEVRLDRDGRELAVGDHVLPAADESPAGPPLTLLDAQHYRPAYWRLGATEGNYRRFFDIDSLVGVRVEDPDVFEKTHGLVAELVRHPTVAGVRVDHVDGLADPGRYLRRLRAHLSHARGGTAGDAPPERVAIVVEKILGADETLDPSWPVDGTTGYEFVDRALALFVDPAGSARLLALGAALTGSHDPAFASESVRAKRQALERSFGGDLDRLCHLSRTALDEELPGHDLAQHDLRQAWTDLTVHLEVYRTYLDGEHEVSAPDRDRIERAARCADPVTKGRDGANQVTRARSLLVARLLAGPRRGGAWLEVARRWQQLSGAVMAKGVEDTATYRYVGLAARADVGSDPDVGRAPEAFHRFAGGRAGLNATSTHDSKRNEDARSRLAALSEADNDWASLVARWHERYRDAGRPSVPLPLDELRAYETLYCLWPAEPTTTSEARGHGDETELRRRAKDYVRKAAREAKVRTSWTERDDRYEAQVTSFIDLLHADPLFRAEMTRFCDSTASAALCNALALVVLKTCCPGVPDFYQGSESFEPALTDPDNRRPVDFDARAASLALLPDAAAEPAAALLAAGLGGPLKLYVIRQLLHERRRSPDLFDRGSYLALTTTSEHALAFARELGRDGLVAVVPRLTYGLATPGGNPLGSATWGPASIGLPGDWPGEARFRDVLTGRAVVAESGSLGLGEVLGVLPIAVLRAERR